VERIGRGLSEVLSQNLPGGIERNLQVTSRDVADLNAGHH